MTAAHGGKLAALHLEAWRNSPERLMVGAASLAELVQVVLTQLEGDLVEVGAGPTRVRQPLALLALSDGAYPMISHALRVLPSPKAAYLGDIPRTTQYLTGHLPAVGEGRRGAVLILEQSLTDPEPVLRAASEIRANAAADVVVATITVSEAAADALSSEGIKLGYLAKDES